MWYLEHGHVLESLDWPKRVRRAAEELRFGLCAVVELDVGEDDVEDRKAMQPLEVPPRRQVAVEESVLRKVVLPIPAARER